MGKVSQWIITFKMQNMTNVTTLKGNIYYYLSTDLCNNFSTVFLGVNSNWLFIGQQHFIISFYLGGKKKRLNPLGSVNLNFIFYCCSGTFFQLYLTCSVFGVGQGEETRPEGTPALWSSWAWHTAPPSSAAHWPSRWSRTSLLLGFLSWCISSLLVSPI